MIEIGAECSLSLQELVYLTRIDFIIQFTHTEDEIVLVNTEKH